MDGTKKWYESLTLQGQLVQVLVALSITLGFEFESESLSIAVQGFFAAVGIAMVVYGRIKAKYILK